MRKTPYDKNAPRRPLSAFTLYMKHRRLTSEFIASKPFAERNRLIGAEWSGLSSEEKQIYHDQAAQAREQYQKALAEYKTSDNYKKWLEENKQNSNQKSSKSEKGLKSCGKSKLSKDIYDEPYTTNQDCKIPIFTREFLEYNRIREVILRQLKKQASQLEEETALLSKHVENLVNAETRVTNQIKTTNELLVSEEALMKRLCKELTTSLNEVFLPYNSTDPDSKGMEHITENSVDSYLSYLDGMKHTQSYADISIKIAQALRNAYSKKNLKLLSL